MLTQLQTRQIPGIIVVAVETSTFPQSLLAGGCTQCKNVIVVKLTQSNSIPTIGINFSGRSPFIYAITFNFGSEDSIGKFAFTVSINRQFEAAFGGMDISQVLSVYVDPKIVPIG